jgi:transglutaminase-like putative cysteine protease
MRIAIRHETRYAFDEPVANAVMRLRLVPPATSAQEVLNWRVTVNDVPVDRWITTGYGEREAIWRSGARLADIAILAEGEVLTYDHAGVTRRIPGSAPPLLFLRATPLTENSAELSALAMSARSETGPLDAMHRLCKRVHETVAYKPGSTSFTTTAAESLEQGSGVCQDQSHIFIAAARVLGVPARYVTGYLRDSERPEDEHAPHAWAEAWVEELGWVAFDCTKGYCPTEDHVRLTVGLDAADAAPIRLVTGPGGKAALSSDVQIVPLPLDDAAQAQTQQ